MDKLQAIAATVERNGYQEIADAIEAAILNGELAPNQKLPNTSQMIEIFHTSRVTIQRSLSRLAERGMVERAPRRGTVVAPGVASRNFGILLEEDPTKPYSWFGRSLHGNLLYRAREFSLNANTYVFHPQVGYSTLRQLEEDIAANRLKCLFVTGISEESRRWLEQNCHIPYLESPRLDLEAMAYEGLRVLLRHGYRRIKALAMSRHPTDVGYAQELRGLQRAWLEAGEVGEAPELVCCGHTESSAYNYVVKCCADPEQRPEAILCSHDVLTRGVLFALSELQLHLPEDIGLLTHVCGGNEPFSLVALDAMVVDVEEVARGILAEIRDNFHHLKIGYNETRFIFRAKYRPGRSIKFLR